MSFESLTTCYYRRTQSTVYFTGHIHLIRVCRITVIPDRMIHAVQTLGIITAPPIIFPTPVSRYPEGLVVVRCGDGSGDSRVAYIMLPDCRCPEIPVFPFGLSALIIAASGGPTPFF